MTHIETKSMRLNFNNVRILLADQNQYYRGILHTVLRNFGAKSIFDAESFAEATAIIGAKQLDLILCDFGLSDRSGLTLVRTVRANKTSYNREVPILVMVGDPSLEVVEAARDAGANMVISKPISPAALFDRLLWVALVQRQYCETETFYGPDRRFKYEGFAAGTGRRKTDAELKEVDALMMDAQNNAAPEYAA